jgi:RHS repeat-associated protein
MFLKCYFLWFHLSVLIRKLVPKSKIVTFSLFSLILFAATSANAQSGPTTLSENAKLIKSPAAVAAYGDDLFGDKLNLYNGALEFVQVDVSLPGNNKLPVMAGRRLVTGDRNIANGHFMTWDLEIPYIHGTFSAQDGWRKLVNGVPSMARCTNFGAPPNLTISDSTYKAFEFWHGNLLYVPGHGSQELLKRNPLNLNFPADGNAWPLVTKGDWAIRCLPSLASTSGSTPANEGGEGFLAIAPDGTQYRFDWLVSRELSSLTKPTDTQPYLIDPWLIVSAPGELGDELPAGVEPAQSIPMQKGGDIGGTISPTGAGGITYSSMQRKEVWIFPTLITDRFGNTVRYTYDTSDKRRLMNIQSSDGRKLTFTYLPNSYVVRTINDGTRTWIYNYSTIGPTTMLSSVVLPDNTSWQLAGLYGGHDPQWGNNGLLNLEVRYVTNADSPPPWCDQPAQDLGGPVASGTMVHPNGAVGKFTMEPVAHGRNGVPRACYNNGTNYGAAYYPAYIDSYSLVEKTISGPGLAPLTWKFDYNGTNVGGWKDCGAPCIRPAIVLATNPKNEVTRYTYGATFDIDEGLLKRVDIGWDGSTALRSTSTSYSMKFTEPVGTSDQNRGDNWVATHRMPLDQRIINQQGVDLYWQVYPSDFDSFARPTRVTNWNSLGYNRTERTAYVDFPSKWIMGQVTSLTDETTGRVAVLNSYNAITAMLETVSHFDKVTESMTYHADGTRASHKDGLNQSTTFTNYKRGIPQTITYPDATGESAVVNNIGKISSFTDQNGLVTGLGYDAMGRVNQVLYPSENGVPWNATTIEFRPVGAWEYGVAPGHWKQTITTGNARTDTVFDSLWRPLFVYTADMANEAATSSIVASRYDASGKNSFTSFPKRNHAALAEGTYGTYTDYDALGRVIAVKTDSELGGTIYNRKSYDANFTTTHTNGRGAKTTYGFQIFSEPTEDFVTSITAPEGVSVTIGRDVFGKPRWIMRSGAGKSATRSYVYDQAQRLCKTIEPETGVTVQSLDLANNVTWRASGLNLTSEYSCDTGNVAEASKISYRYDSLNRLLDTTYGDASPAITRTYTPDGMPLTVNSNGSNWTYGYNSRRLLDRETLAYGGTSYALTRRYDRNGGLAQLTYPDNTTVAYSPNALGQPTQAGAYASAVTYHPNGAIKSFNYGNGIARNLTQNVRGLPERATDTGVLDDAYAYDPIANVTAIVDWQEGVSTRSMEYDLLDRLTRVNAPAMWGDAWYQYDALDNLAHSNMTGGTGIARTMAHNYDPTTNRLLSITGTAGFDFTYGYDNQGNITQRGAQAYVFDQANRMKQATGKATYGYDGWGRRTSMVGIDGTNRLQMYAQDGKVVFGGPTGGTKTKYIYLHNHVVAEVDGAGTQYVHTDGLGSPIARTDAARGLISRTRYEPYGRTAMGTAPTIGFTGHVSDNDTGLVYMQQRYYDPVAGRMLSIDPVTTDAKTGSGFNRYNYAANNPYRFIDPDGRAIRSVNKENNEALAKRIEEKAAGKWGFDKKNNLVLKDANANAEGKSKHYKERLLDGIKSSDKISLNIDAAIKVNGTWQNVDSVNGGGATVARGGSKDREITISGNDNVSPNNGTLLRSTPADILLHELVGHAIPQIVGGGTGNAIDNANRALGEIPGQVLRDANPGHTE